VGNFNKFYFILFRGVFEHPRLYGVGKQLINSESSLTASAHAQLWDGVVYWWRLWCNLSASGLIRRVRLVKQFRRNEAVVGRGDVGRQAINVVELIATTQRLTSYVEDSAWTDCMMKWGLTFSVRSLELWQLGLLLMAQRNL